MNRLRNIWLVTWTLMLEAWRRKEIYAIVIVTTLMIVGLRMVHFFEIDGLGKFYREMGLKVMNFTTALTVILLAARQLPREFSNRTIYPLLAKPVGRMEFLAGKYFGVLLAGYFCYALFMVVFMIGSFTLDAPYNHTLFIQAIFLQCLSFAVLTAMVFMFSMMMNIDAAITLSTILFVASQILMNLMREAYDTMESTVLRSFLLLLHFIIPQLTLFDASAKVVHSVSVIQQGQDRVELLVWEPLPWGTVGTLTVYALVYIVVFLTLSYLLFRRKPL